MRIELTLLLLCSLLLTEATYARSEYAPGWFRYYLDESSNFDEKLDLYAGIFPQINYDTYNGAYTPAELAALDKALWTQNLTRTDLNFDKDFGKGHACFPVVREMMADPLLIASTLESLGMKKWSLRPDPATDWIIRSARLGWGEAEPMPYEQWVASGDWAFELEQGDPWSYEDIAQLVETDFTDTVSQWESNEFDAIRLKLTELFAWHPGIGSPTFDSTKSTEIEEWIKQQSPSWYMRLLSEGSHGFNSSALAIDYLLRFSNITDWAKRLPASFFPAETPQIIETEAGAVVLGTFGPDRYVDLDAALLIEPGGDDVYINCKLGCVDTRQTRGAALFIDLGGDDLYDCADVDITLGAAVLGVAAFYDLGGGNDRYYAGSVSLGAAIGGVATFYDDGGSDYYSGKVYTQGAAGFGIAVMCDDSVGEPPLIPSDIETPDPIDMAAMDNDHYTAWCEAQGFARTRGIAICTNARGNEVYHAGGVYLDAPLFTDRYCSFSQGFAIGERQIDYAGGIALLADYGGNDRYLGDVYNQGVGYWYSAGLLYDGGGNDHYEMTQYGQGSGIHLAVGGLLDEAGSDTYIMNNGLGQGGSHDYAASVFMDRGGDDRYLGNTSCNGCGLTNSVGLFFDRSGNDVYAGKRDALNTGRPARGFGGIGVLVDLGGTDDYLGRMRDDTLWAQPQYGMGLDVGEVFGPVVGIAPEEKREGAAANAAGFDKPSEGLKLPEVLSYDGALTQAVFDELWELAIRWEVGDNRVIVPEARKKLVSFGAEVLPLVAARMGDVDTGLALRAQVDVIKGVIGGVEVLTPVPAGETALPLPPAPPHVVAILSEQLASGDETRTRNSLQIIAELKIISMGDALAAFIDTDDPALKRRAVSVIGQIGSHAADDKLLALLDPATDEKLLKLAIEAVTTLELDCAGLLIPLLIHPSFAVRDTLEHQLALHINAYDDVWGNFQVLYRDFGPSGPPLMPGTQRTPQFERAVLRVLQHAPLRTDVGGNYGTIFQMHGWLKSPDAGVRLEAGRLLDHWEKLVRDRMVKSGQIELPDIRNDLSAREPDAYSDQGLLDLIHRIRASSEPKADPPDQVLDVAPIVKP